MALDQKRREIAHLFRRAGLGATLTEIEYWAKRGRRAAVDYLVNFERVSNKACDQAAAAIDPWNHPDDLWRWWFTRMVTTKRPLQERMTLFWHNHWACSQEKVGHELVMYLQNQLFRRHALPNWRAMCYDVTRDPAMLVFLDNVWSSQWHPNENYAREFLELHTMGINNGYTQADILAAARGFTGWSLEFHWEEIDNLADQRDAILAGMDPNTDEYWGVWYQWWVRILQVEPTYLYRADWHDNNAKTFLGITGNHNGDKIIDTVVARPEAAAFICRKLWNHFVADGPVPPAKLTKLTGLYTSSRTSLKPVVKEILNSDEFYAPANYRTKTKNPTEYFVSAVRLLQCTVADADALRDATESTGQDLFYPPNPAGWPPGKAWINANTILERSNQVNRIASGRPPSGQSTPRIYWNPTNLLPAGMTDAGQIVEHFLDRLVDGQVPSATRNELIDYMHRKDDGSYQQFVFNPTNVDKKVRGLVYLILSSPAFQLA